MAENGYQGNMKEKISAVRSAAQNKSNNEIVLVLQQFDNNVDKAIQAFVDGSALEILQEWSMPGKKKINKRKRSKCKPQLSDKGCGDDEAIAGPQGVCGYKMNGFDKDNLSSDSANEKTDAILEAHKRTTSDEPCQDSPHKPLQAHTETAEGLSPEQNGKSEYSDSKPFTRVHRTECLPSSAQKFNRSRPKKTAAAKLPTPLDIPKRPTEEMNKKRVTNVEKSVKDLQRCTVSLGRYRIMIKEEMDSSVKKIKATFAELHSCIVDREVALMSEVDKVKQEAMDILTARQKKAEELKRMTDLASQMSDIQLSELRAEIKHFVSERKYDEELGRSARFSCDIEQLTSQIMCCGEISHPKNSYSLRPSDSTTASSEGLLATVRSQRSSRQNPSSNVKAWDKKISAKPTDVIPADPAELSRLTASPTKQNGPSTPRRRYNPRSQGLRANGVPALSHSEPDPNLKSSHGSGQPQPPHNGFRNRSKGGGRNDDSYHFQRSSKSPAISRPMLRNHLELEPRFIHRNVPGVSNCHLQPTMMETVADARGRSVRTLTLVA